MHSLRGRATATGLVSAIRGRIRTISNPAGHPTPNHSGRSRSAWKNRCVLLRRTLGTRRPQRHPAHAGRARLRLQRHRHGGVTSMPKTTFTAATSTASSVNNKISIEDFVAYLPKHLYIFTPCRELWIASGVDACLPRMQVFTKSGKPKRDKNGDLVYEAATKWLDRNKGMTQATWCPGQPMLIQDRIVVDGGWIEKQGAITFNW